ncbi:MAG TPA: peptidoglycan endopeptidase [Sphingomonas sp.]|nr:peptidoglycan endopeptidase [Sphingomonas sp.]
MRHTASDHVAEAAGALVGVRFRPHGRDPRFGLDCVGLAACALRAGGYAGPVPDDYALRHGNGAQARALIDTLGLIAGIGGPGELLLCASAPRQVHLAISISDGLVHADALLRRVVARPGAVPWPVLGRWRLEEE